MNRREYERKLRKWEAEGYDVSELREKWFPPGKAKGRSPIVMWSVIVTAVFIIVAGTGIWMASQSSAPRPAPAPAPAPTPTPKSAIAPAPKPAPAPTGQITLNLSGGASLVISDSLPPVALSELKRSLQIIPQGKTYQFTKMPLFYLRNVTANPVKVYPHIPLEEGIPERFCQFTPIIPTTKVGTEWLLMEEPLWPNETIAVSLLPVGSLEEMRQLFLHLREGSRPNSEEIEGMWLMARSFWEYVLSQGHISFSYVLEPPSAPAPAPVPQPQAGPVIIGPQGGEITGLRPSIAWQAVTGTTMYQVILATDPGLKNRVAGTPVFVTAPSWQPAKALAYDTTYFFGITAVEPTVSPQSIGTFTTMSPSLSEQTIIYTMGPGSISTSWVAYSKLLQAGDHVTGTVQLTGTYHATDWSYTWTFEALDPQNNVMQTWPGHWVNNNHHTFSFTASQNGTYKIKITHWSMYNKNLQIEVKPAGWSQSGHS